MTFILFSFTHLKNNNKINEFTFKSEEKLISKRVCKLELSDIYFHFTNQTLRLCLNL